MKLLRAMMAAMLAAVTMSYAVVASAQGLADIKNAGTLRIGVLVDFPPYGSLDAKNNPVGYDIDVANLIAEKLGVKAQIVPVTGPNRIPYLLTGKVDVLVAALGILKSRAQQVSFSQPYGGFDAYMYGVKQLDVPGVAALKGRRVGVARGSVSDINLTPVVPEGTILQRFDNDFAVKQALLTEQIDLMPISDLEKKWMEQVAGPDKFSRKFNLSTQVQGAAVKPGQAELLKAIDAVIAQARADGTLNAYQHKWLGTDLPDLKMPDLS